MLRHPQAQACQRTRADHLRPARQQEAPARVQSHAQPCIHRTSREPPHSLQKFLGSKGFGDVGVRSLLLPPKFVTGRIPRTHEDHRDACKHRIPFQFAAYLETIAGGHNNIQKDYAGMLKRDGFFNPERITQADRGVAFLIENSLHQFDSSYRVIDHKHFLQHTILRYWARNINARIEPIWTGVGTKLFGGSSPFISMLWNWRCFSGLAISELGSSVVSL